MKLTVVSYEKRSAVGILRLNRPERMNAVNEAMYCETGQVLDAAQSDSDVRVMILTGSVYEKEGRIKQAFCAGADLKEHASGTRDRAQKRAYIELAHETTRMLYEFPKPVIAAINGAARGAGVEMALNCDFICMADTATLAFTETGLGTFVGGGVTSHLGAMIGIVHAKELIYTGRVIDGREAVSMGIALESVPVEQLFDRAMALAAVLSLKAPRSMALAKSCLQNARLLDLQEVLKRETEGILSCMETEDWHEGIAAFMEKRTPVFRGR